MAGKLFGRAFIRVNGMTTASLPGGSIDLGGFERTPVVGDFGFLGYTEKPMHGEIECDIAVDATTDLVALGKTVGATVTFESDSGQVYILRDAFLTSPIKLGDGKASLKFSGSAAESNV